MNNSAIQQNFERIRSNKAFELFVVAVIIGSALLVGAKTYELTPSSRSLIIWLDMLITVIFVAEIAHPERSIRLPLERPDQVVCQ